MYSFISGVRKAGRRRAVVGVLAVASLLSTAPDAAAQTAAGPVIELGETWRVVFVAVLVGVFAALWFTLMWRDRTQTNARINKLLDAFIDEQKERGPERPWSLEERRTVIGAAATKGATGLTRTTIALGLLTLVGVALAALLVGNGANASDLLKTVVTALTTALTTVLGFYFGAKATSDAVAQGAAPGGGAGGPAKGIPPGAPTITGVEPGSGQVSVTFTAPAKTGDSPITSYTVTSDPGGIKATGTKSPIVVPGLSKDRSYKFKVHATNASGDGPESGESKEVTPSA